MMTWALTVAGFLMALIAGVFLSFSDFIMRGLAQAAGTEGPAAMVGINRTVYHSIFMVFVYWLVSRIGSVGTVGALAIGWYRVVVGFSWLAQL